MRVSVVIPVYNAKRFVAQAVHSALMQPEAAEVLVIDDGSTDGTSELCHVLAGQSPRTRVLQHADGRNRGASASRNLGIRESRCDYIAFLDADDYFLPDRFSVARELFAGDPDAEGVYEAMGLAFEEAQSEERWLEVRGDRGLTTMSDRVAPEELFEKQGPIGHSGYCTTGGWVVKKSIFSKTGLFDEHLRQGEDTVMFVKFAAKGRMLAGRLQEPVVMRRVHRDNRSSARRSPARLYRDRIRMWGTLWRWGRRHLPDSRRSLVLRRFLSYAATPYRETGSELAEQLLPRVQLTILPLLYPALVLEQGFWLQYRRTMLPYHMRKRLTSVASGRWFLREDTQEGG